MDVQTVNSNIQLGSPLNMYTMKALIDLNMKTEQFNSSRNFERAYINITHS